MFLVPSYLHFELVTQPSHINIPSHIVVIGEAEIWSLVIQMFVVATRDRVSCRPRWPQNHFVTENDFEILNLLPLFLSAGITGMCMLILCSAGESNLGLHACEAITVSTETHSWPHSNLLNLCYTQRLSQYSWRGRHLGMIDLSQWQRSLTPRTLSWVLSLYPARERWPGR